MTNDKWLRFRPRPSVISALALVLLGILGPLAGQSPDDLNFLAGLPDSQSYRGMLASYLKSRAEQALAERGRSIARLTSASDVAGRKRYVRERMLESFRRAGAEKELRILRRKPSDTPRTLYRDMLQRGGDTG